MHDARSTFSSPLTLALVAVSACTAFLLRVLPWKNFLGAHGEYLFYGPDAYDHLRRITMGIAEFPRIPLFDSYYGYPVGTGQIWAPLFDYLITIVALVCGGRADGGVTHFIGFWLSPALAFFTVFMVYAAADRIFGRNAGMAAACIMAVLPGHILYTFVSELDHHAVEPLVCLAIMISVLKWAGAPDPRPRAIPGWLRTGFWLVFAILIWRGSIIFWGVALTAMTIQMALIGYRGESLTQLSRYGRNVCLSAAAFLIPLCVFNLFGTSSGISFGIVSWFHVIFLLLFWLLFALVERAFPVGRRMGGIAAVLLGLAVLSLFIPGSRAFIFQFISGLSVIGGSDPWLDSIAELRSMLFPGGKLDLWHATETLSFLYWLFPVIIGLGFRQWRRGGYRDMHWCLFLVWGGIFWLFPLFRERYVHLTAVTVALGGGYLFSLLANYFSTEGAMSRRAWLAVGAMLLLLAPTATFLASIPGLGLPDYEKNDLMAALAWLRERTPETSYFDHPVRRPEYGVLADWGIGAYITYVGRRPVVATNFGWETHGLFESAAFMTLSDPLKAEKIAKDNGVRYIFLNEIAGNLPRLRAIAEFGLARDHGPSAVLPPFDPLGSMYYRLYIQHGSSFQVEGVRARALGAYRLMYGSSGGIVDPVAGFVSRYQIFERVPGAVLRGHAPPGSEVVVRLLLKDSAGRIVSWRDHTVVGNDGGYMFRVPYATDSNSGDYVPQGPYEILTGERSHAVKVKELDVTSGSVVVVQ